MHMVLGTMLVQLSIRVLSNHFGEPNTAKRPMSNLLTVCVSPSFSSEVGASTVAGGGAERASSFAFCSALFCSSCCFQGGMEEVAAAGVSHWVKFTLTGETRSGDVAEGCNCACLVGAGSGEEWEGEVGGAGCSGSDVFGGVVTWAGPPL